MRQADAKALEIETAEATLTPAEMEMLAKVRSVSQQITERVAKTLADARPRETPSPEDVPSRA